MGNRKDNKAQMDQHLYDTAIDLFCEIGYKQTTLIDIASEAKVSTRTLYRYYPTKESILKRFAKENILSLKSFSGKLPHNAPLKDKIIDTMTQDFKLMFCLFDVSYILHTARDKDGMFARFELEDVLAAETIYCNLMKQEQLKYDIEPNEMISLCASVVMGIYRHCVDLYRFRKKGTFDEKDLRAFFESHINAIWDSLYQTLITPPKSKSTFFGYDKHLFSSADNLKND